VFCLEENDGFSFTMPDRNNGVTAGFFTFERRKGGKKTAQPSPGLNKERNRGSRWASHADASHQGEVMGVHEEGKGGGVS